MVWTCVHHSHINPDPPTAPSPRSRVAYALLSAASASAPYVLLMECRAAFSITITSAFNTSYTCTPQPGRHQNQPLVWARVQAR